jgi:hypothetical protein
MKVRLVSLNIGSIVLLILVGVLVFRYSCDPQTADGTPAHCDLCARGTPCASSKLDEFLVRNKWIEPPGPDAGPLLLETGDSRIVIRPKPRHQAPLGGQMEQASNASN